MNNVSLSGRLTHDVELNKTNNGVEFINFAIAVNRPFQNSNDEQQCDFINCVAWRHNAIFISKFFSKGDGIVLSGSLQHRVYKTKDNTNKHIVEVVVDNCEFPLSRNSNKND